MDICAPCERYERAIWDASLGTDPCCLTCAHLEDEEPCPELSRRIRALVPHPLERTQVPRGGEKR